MLGLDVALESARQASGSQVVDAPVSNDMPQQDSQDLSAASHAHLDTGKILNAMHVLRLNILICC